MRQEELFALCQSQFPDTVRRLSELVAIPSCSFPGYPKEEVVRSAEATARWLRDVGLPEVQVLTLPGVNPYVLARDHRAGPDKPILLLYAHHDVQPPMREELWTTAPFEPSQREGRLYGRGSADDKAGIALHAASIAAWYALEGALPINVTVLVEGEEEVGSDHLATFLHTHLDLLAADGVVIADLANYDVGLPSLTISLRGLVAVELELRGLERPVHSGLWGGAVPDVVQTLCRILSSMSHPDGTLAIPGILDGTQGKTGNVLMDSAWARVGIRIVPGMDPRRTMDLLKQALEAQVPPGFSLKVTEESLAPAWGTSTAHPLFAKARKALEAGYGKAPVEVGCGASIPFVESVTSALGGVPALLVGVEDPSCNAHSENESLHLGDLLSAIKSQAALFGEVGRK